MKSSLFFSLNVNKLQLFHFLTLLLLSKEAKAGKWFSDCLIYDPPHDYSNDIDLDGSKLYNSLVNFPFSANNMSNTLLLKLCCNNYQCVINSDPAHLCSFETDNTNFSCTEIGQTIFCYSSGSLCGGIVGGNSATKNISLGLCPDTTQLANNLTQVDIKYGNRFFSSFCPFFSCGQYRKDYDGLYCFWDNDVWTCYALDQDNRYFSCISQLKGPLPINKNFPSTVSSPSVNLDLVKIIAPIGTVVGVAFVSALVWYMIRWRKITKQKERRALEQREKLIKLENLVKKQEKIISEQAENFNLSLDEEINNQPKNNERLSNEIHEQYQTYTEVGSSRQ